MNLGENACHRIRGSLNVRPAERDSPRSGSKRVKGEPRGDLEDMKGETEAMDEELKGNDTNVEMARENGPKGRGRSDMRRQRMNADSYAPAGSSESAGLYVRVLPLLWLARAHDPHRNRQRDPLRPAIFIRGVDDASLRHGLLIRR